METTPSSEFAVHFWGVRGSVPSPGKDTVRYGGNTSCVEMRVAGKRLIFDGGTGLRMLGKSLKPQLPIEAYWFFTHYHWDHIQGVPFFEPAFTTGNTLHIHGAAPEGASMEQHFKKRVLHLNSPVPIREIQADLKFYDIICGDTVQLGDITIETSPLNHPNGAMGYRISWQGHSVVYCTDTEHFPDRLDENVLHLSRDADILIYDAMYTDEEYHHPKSPKVGWGHSTWQEGVRVAKEAGVKRLAIFHHEPNHTDNNLDQIEIEVKEAHVGSFLAREGLVVPII
ncbi:MULTISPECIES: MBL fold metallo-hydrolase [unclassified Coleofasciculus]|uniref:MBL fold metallo-hydrolase n=1 Tax=unclassified Coleofasciculus TaxID=2692782 RepID=UPI0018829DF7|nr:MULTISPECIES: MBL fold metallo-hydrolase [unclassified Coleofasciculus]MBE9125430.1 MBL fold metallo-hydrolase [Coleofasciculus sp. LEGE 07081]MBE9147116.1 MBL fold metallo-hydrolase [Coleofasciculus sp. LEGE 07092]